MASIKAIREASKAIVPLLASKDYEKISSLTNGRRLAAADIEAAVSSYGREIILPPNEVFGEVDVNRVEKSVQPIYSVVVPLWSKQEGISDLSLEMTLIEENDGTLVVEIDNIRVR